MAAHRSERALSEERRTRSGFRRDALMKEAGEGVPGWKRLQKTAQDARKRAWAVFAYASSLAGYEFPADGRGWRYSVREVQQSMGFVVMFVAAWLAVFIFYCMHERLSILENAFAFLVVLTLGINASWIVAEELKLVELTKDGLLYAGFIVYRTVVMPLVFVIALNAIVRAERAAVALFAAAASVAALVALNAAALHYDIVRYEKWNLGYDAIAHVLMLAVVYALLRLYRRAVYGRAAS